jgi:hypothetical protein
MLKFKPAGWMTLLICLAIMALVGCNAKPFDYQPTAGEMKQGPGVLTGEDGELTIYDSEKGGAFPKESDATVAGTSVEKTAQATAAAGTTAAAAAGSQDKAGEFQEFQEYQQWQKEKEQFRQYQQWKNSTAGSADFKDFQEYQQWKKSGKSSAEYKEFQEWREFKAYQEWKKSQKP